MVTNTQITDQAIQKMGGPVSAARKLGIPNYQTIQQWKLVPARYCVSVEANTGISRRDLRPSDWQCYWPELTKEAADA